MVSTKGDVYSYGIILLEMLTGKKITGPSFHGSFKLQNFVSSVLSSGVNDVIDPFNLQELSTYDAAKANDCLVMLLGIGVRCAQESPKFRPDIKDTLRVLETIRSFFEANTGCTQTYAIGSLQAAVSMALRNRRSLLWNRLEVSEMPSPNLGETNSGRTDWNVATARQLLDPFPQMAPNLATVSYMDLHKATNGFSSANLVGAGGFGSVYKGTFNQGYVHLLLRDSEIVDEIGIAVAIKVFNLQRREYGLGCKMTTKGDTYSFGILLLEMLTGKKPTHRMFRGGLTLHNFVSLALPDNVFNITDTLMKGAFSGILNQYEKSSWLSFSNVGGFQLRKLQRIVLSNNRLTGSIPASIGNLSMLDEVHLENNELNGTIPSSFGNCPMLVLLDLSQNNLSGTIPNQFFHVSPFSVKLNLSQNHLVGSLPAGIGALKTLVKLDVSENELSGLIPTELYDCSALESLYMRGNFIQGFKSQPVKKLRALQNIDLSRNNLSGKIPDFFETLHLKYLNLSWNNLEGDVPKKGLFANASAYSIVGNRLCGGIPELQLPKMQ
ncbi:hypothetical protein ACET3Z_029271 [Daucus carota]